jgi:hypothetical protein
MGDFNLVYKDEDKNSGNLNRTLMHRFIRALNFLEVKEIQLNGRKFTWTNRQANPSMSRIVKAFCSVQWEHHYDKPFLQALSSSTSDHCPLLLMPLQSPITKPRFRFESFWTEMPGFSDVVTNAWDTQVQSSLNPLNVMHIKLSRTAKALKHWAKSLIPQTKLAMAICREVIHQLEAAQENRQLSAAECDLITNLKHRILGLAAIEKCRARQKFRITWLRKSDANTKYFQIIANIRKQKKIIHSLQTDDLLATTQKEKQQVIHDHFLEHI